MKLCLLFICGFLATSHLQTESESLTPDQVSQQEAVMLVGEISQDLANLIIHIKQNNHNPEITKEHSVKLIKTITEVIARCIQKAKNKKLSKSICLQDQETLEIMIEQITIELLAKIITQTGSNI